jgi:RHS repeat-associated protein
LVEGGQKLIFIDRKGMQGKSQILKKTGAVAYINEYYPFGLQNQQTSSTQFGSKEQRYKYNGKELFKDFKLEVEDYGARLYSPQIGRWTILDPLADKYISLTPYSYVANNPLKYIDPKGEDILIVHRNGKGVELSSAIYKDGKLFYTDGVTPYTSEDAYVKRVAKTLDNLEKLDDRGNKVVDALVNDKGINEISNYEINDKYRASDPFNPLYNRPDDKGSFTKFDIYSDSKLNNGRFSKEEQIAHEFKHRFNKLNGLSERDKKPSRNKKTPYGEVDAVNFQNIIRSLQGNEPKTTHKGIEINPADLIDAQQYILLQRYEERNKKK